MPACLYIIVEGEDPGFDTFVNGRALARNESALEQIAEQLGAPPLLAFFSAEEESLAVAYEQGGQELAREPEPQLVWFSGEDGLLTIRALINYLESVPAALGAERSPVLLELREFEDVLTKTAQHGLLWRLSVSWS